jgi:hypothetical protein
VAKSPPCVPASSSRSPRSSRPRRPCPPSPCRRTPVPDEARLRLRVAPRRAAGGQPRRRAPPPRHGSGSSPTCRRCGCLHERWRHGDRDELGLFAALRGWLWAEVTAWFADFDGSQHLERNRRRSSLSSTGLRRPAARCGPSISRPGGGEGQAQEASHGDWTVAALGRFPASRLAPSPYAGRRRVFRTAWHPAEAASRGTSRIAVPTIRCRMAARGATTRISSAGGAVVRPRRGDGRLRAGPPAVPRPAGRAVDDVVVYVPPVGGDRGVTR